MSVGMAYALAGIAFVGSWLVKRYLKSTYKKWSKVENQYKVTGAQTAAAILEDQGITGVKLEQVRGKLTDHYDPSKDILRLSQQNWGKTSVSAMAVSAHEAGHAMQDFSGDLRLKLRKFLVPLAALGARFGPIVVMAGLVTGSDGILKVGALLLAGMTIFQLATLPVEFNASRRALESLERLGLSDPEQRDGVEAVLRAAALTYVAAAATSLAYFAMLFARGRGRWIV